MEKHKNAHLEGELVKLRKSAVEIVSAAPVQHHHLPYATALTSELLIEMFIGLESSD